MVSQPVIAVDSWTSVLLVSLMTSGAAIAIIGVCVTALAGKRRRD
jgi:hypothetical protein